MSEFLQNDPHKQALLKDIIRRQIKEVRRLYTERQWRNLYAALKALGGMIKNMAFMEERILFPNALKRLSDRDWVAIRRGEAEIGYASSWRD